MPQHRANYVGRVLGHGNLKVLRLAGDDVSHCGSTEHGSSLWVAECRLCGQEVTRSASAMKLQKSCGCLHKGRGLGQKKFILIETRRLMVEMRHDGYGRREIAAKVGCDETYVSQILGDMGARCKDVTEMHPQKIDTMPLRDVTASVASVAEGKKWRLTLSTCGHVVARIRRNAEAPTRARCDKCPPDLGDKVGMDRLPEGYTALSRKEAMAVGNAIVEAFKTSAMAAKASGAEEKCFGAVLRSTGMIRVQTKALELLVAALTKQVRGKVTMASLKAGTWRVA